MAGHITVLHWAIAKHAGLATFYGPALVPELGGFPTVLTYTDRFLRAAWFNDVPIGYEPSDVWTDEFLNFNTKADLSLRRDLRKSEGWIAVREGAASGPLLGGCLETICWHLKGSTSWLDPSGAILFLETSEAAPPPEDVDSYLTDLEQLGVFDSAAALLFARPYGYDVKDTDALWSVVADRTEQSGIPVLANIEAGHTDPMMTLPLGVPAEIDTANKHLRLLEPATANRA